MRKKRTGVTQQDVQRWVKAWKNDCLKKNRSFTSIADVPSRGRASEGSVTIECDKTIVKHSDLEYNFCLLVRFHPRTTNLETQVPLIDMDNEVLPQTPTIEIEKAMDIKEARFRGSKTNWIYTEDALITQSDDGQDIKLARSMKYLKDLVFFENDSDTIKQNKKRTWELLNVQKVYFESKGINWKIITERSINRNVIDNIERFDRYLEKSTYSNDEFDLALTCFEAECKRAKHNEELQEMLSNISAYSGIPYKDTVSIFWQLCWYKKITFDLRKERLEMNSIINPATFFKT
ncbi:TnsA endonuclease N-terminal domain-containing protein [Endozoicomonas euniceicola]|uniref:TnsA endonuclease N-terminal domain-containing protein n=1 Tax=Endozoicomonas euniceicola TaxID=1234143 RepID=A0ABY6GRT0_9GAMM|nr:TnsA endonuclease N-terminal domain-containing protein [Endozoicomonas euniceicola]UYM15453.1 TnsA endonuclease N-terminal domain-containing protein [Endozoicomonas euniceicola]